jgi:hypothetical protein
MFLGCNSLINLGFLTLAGFSPTRFVPSPVIPPDPSIARLFLTDPSTARLFLTDPSTARLFLTDPSTARLFLTDPSILQFFKHKHFHQLLVSSSQILPYSKNQKKK